MSAIKGVENKEGHLTAVALEWLTADFRPRLIVRPDLHVLWSNPSARQLLGEDAGVILREDALHFSSTARQMEFVEYVRQLGPELDTISVQGSNQAARLLFRGRRIQIRGGSAACLEFACDAAEFRARYCDVDRVFALTAAEHRVVTGLLNGRAAGQIASDLLISVDTVRTHVRHAYSKIGVRSREELFSRLHPYRIL